MRITPWVAAAIFTSAWAPGGCAESPPVTPPDPCGAEALVFSASEADVTARTTALVERLRAGGAPTAYLREAAQGTQAQAVIAHVQYALGVAPVEDPRPAALAWLESVDPSLRAAEYAPDPARRDEPSTTALNDIFWAYLLRVRAGDVPLRASAQGAPALTIGINKLSDGWRVDQITVAPALAFAARDDARLQERCMPAAPPDETRLRARAFRGLLLVGCGIVGEYEYVPDGRDRVAWVDEVVWTIGAPPSGAPAATARAAWIPSRRATLTIDPANYFADIHKADCWCHDVAGWTLTAHAITGEVLRYLPGINCIIC